MEGREMQEGKDRKMKWEDDELMVWSEMVYIEVSFGKFRKFQKDL